MYIDLDGGRQGRSEEVWRVGGSEEGEDGSEGATRGGIDGREEAMMLLGRERASVEEGRVANEGGWIDGGNERGRDGTRHVQREGKRGEEASGGGIERGRERAREEGELGREGNFK